jgi:hypothetical protein
VGSKRGQRQCVSGRGCGRKNGRQGAGVSTWAAASVHCERHHVAALLQWNREALPPVCNPPHLLQRVLLHSDCIVEVAGGGEVGAGIPAGGKRRYAEGAEKKEARSVSMPHQTSGSSIQWHARDSLLSALNRPSQPNMQSTLSNPETEPPPHRCSSSTRLSRLSLDLMRWPMPGTLHAGCQQTRRMSRPGGQHSTNGSGTLQAGSAGLQVHCSTCASWQRWRQPPKTSRWTAQPASRPTHLMPRRFMPSTKASASCPWSAACLK